MGIIYDEDKQKETFRFIDYFFICGLAEDKPIEVYKQLEENEFSKYIENNLVASILCHFPENVVENPWQSDELWKLCAPGGLKVFVSKKDPLPEERIHTFILTREDGSKYYGHILTFFEPSSNQSVTQNIRNVLGMSSIDTNFQLYVEKCFGFITPNAFFNSCKTILTYLFQNFVKENKIIDGFCIESYIYNLLYEVPLLTHNCSCRISCIPESCGGDALIIQKPSKNELPPLDINLSDILQLLGGPSNLINLLTSVLLERSILLVSKENRMQMHVAESITSLIFPFRWPYALVSVLPVDLAVHFFDAPIPYIIGVVVPSKMKLVLRRELKDNQCYVDLDNAVVECPEDQPNFPGQEDLIKKLNKFLEHYHKQLRYLSEQAVVATKKRSISAGTQKEIRKVSDEKSDANNTNQLKVDAVKFNEDKLNTCIRETIVSSFVNFFFQYEKFIIQPVEEEGSSWHHQTDEIFDKTSFISDQPKSRLPFLLPFLDTMMFAYLIDSWLISHPLSAPHHQDLLEKDPHLRLFDDRIEQLKVLPDQRTPVPSPVQSAGRIRTLSISSTNFFLGSNQVDSWIQESEQGYKRRMLNVDFVSPPLHVLQDHPEDQKKLEKTSSGRLPKIKEKLLAYEGWGKKKHVRRVHESRRAFKRQNSRSESKWRKLAELKNKLLAPPNLTEFSSEIIARTNWKFVEKLLNDCRIKTKRLLIGKMGQEAVALGWSEIGIAGLEENTWIAGLCDLLERVWSHGLETNERKGKSALWSHLLSFHAATKLRQQLSSQENCEAGLTSRRQIGGSTPSIVDATAAVTGKQGEERTGDDCENYYHSLPRSFLSSSITSRSQLKDNKLVQNCDSNKKAERELMTSLRNVMSMRDVHTDVGRSRAWIRLALEQKKLHDYLNHLLLDSDLLKKMYKKYSLLQCEDERQQFLYHLLTLKTADFNSFTNSFPKTDITYRVAIFPSRQISLASGGTSANVYLRLHGELRHTAVMDVPRGTLNFVFKHTNLGFITSLIIGHDNYGVFPNWRLDFITVTNEVTGQVYAFPCFRSLGRGVDDNSIERLLVAHQLPLYCNIHDHIDSLANEASKRTSIQPTIAELQEKIGQSVNNLITFFNRTQSSHTSISPSNSILVRLLTKGLVAALFDVFSHGLKRNKSRFIHRKPAFCWELISAINERLQGSSPSFKRKSSRLNLNNPTSINNQFFATDFFLCKFQPNL